ncbi:MAG: InlB B-repeat-containing protein [Thermoplasmata archaeon]
MTSMRELSAKWWKRLPKTAIPATAIVALFLLSGFASAASGTLALPGAPTAIGSTPTATHNTASTGFHAPATRTSVASAGAPAAPLAPVSNGRGTFFNNSAIAFPNGPGNQTCIYGTSCVNNSNDPSINLTSNGVLGVAYTEYTNESPCANVSAYAQSEIGFSSSTNGGTTWSTPIYLGNTNCSVANWYASAWEPSLTSLANGTLVVAFIAYNFSSTYDYLPYSIYFGPYSWDIPHAALMLTESYDNGVTWTTPQVLNSSANPGLNASAFTPERPWITAYGSTVYVTWMNYSKMPTSICCYYNASGGGRSAIHLLVSTTGGTSWGSQIDINNILNPTNASIGLNPFVMTDPSGNLYIAYSTNWTFWYQYPQGCSKCRYDVWTTEVALATSSNNGTSFSYSVIAADQEGVPYRWSNMVDPSPQLAYNPTNGQVYATWSAYTAQQICTSYGYCYTANEEVNRFSNSSTGGSTWSPAHLVSSQLTSPNGQQEYNPTIAVTSDGTIHFAGSYINESPAACLPPYGYDCPQWEVYANSTDNGATFSTPVMISDNVTYEPYAPDGEYVSSVASGSQVWFAWAHEFSDQPPTTYVYFPGPDLADNIMVSTLFQGAGVSLTFVESGLQPGTSWSINILGNERVGSAPTSLVFSGVPPTANLSWVVGSVNGGYGIRYFSTASISPPWTFGTTSTIYENYTEQVLVNVTSNPNIPACGISYNQYCWNYTYQIHENYNITPGPQAYWVNVNSSFTESVTPAGYYCVYSYCYTQWLNLTFQSWTGSGSGSVNSSAYNISFVARGPVNETANFRVDGTCIYFYYYSPPLQCLLLNQTLLFHETGLPSGVSWTVTLSGATGTTLTQTSNGSWMTVASAATLGFVNYIVWTIPIGTTGMYWIGTGDPVSPVELPGNRIVNISFTAGYPTSGNFFTSFSSAGLPNETAWTLDLGSNSYGVENATYNTTLSGGSYTVGSEPIYLDNGSGYYLSQVGVESFVENQTTAWHNTSTVPASVSLNGSGFVVLTYSAQYYATVTAGTGGTVTPVSQWVHSGAALQLNETPEPGYSFVGWTGMGSGSITSTSPNPVAHPAGPITELATFQLIPPPLWTVNVTEVGLPSAASYSVTIGTQTISGTGQLSVTGLTTGSYPVSFAYAYDNASNMTRYMPTSWTTSFTMPSAGMIQVGADGTVQVTFVTQYLLTVTSTGSGSVAPAPGVGWENAGTMVSLSATPDPHYMLAGWFGTGAGSVNATTLQVTPTINGPVKETAQFVWKPTSPPETFNLTVASAGLPSGILWNASAGAQGVAGQTVQLRITGLNGTYQVTIAPVQISAGVRYVASGSGVYNVSVQNNAMLNVTFTKQYLLTIANSTGGTAQATGSQWVNDGATVTLTATVTNSTWVFASWNGTGSGSYSGNLSTTTITMTGPTTELATFEPVYPVHTTGSTSDGQTTAIGLFVVLLVVALLVGLLVGRRRRSPPRDTSEETAMPEETEGADAAADESTMAPPAAAEYDEGQP